MKDEHLSEEMMHQYALDQGSCGTDVLLHVDTCEYCRESAQTYHLLFAAIKQQPAPVFDFDVSNLVLEKLSKQLPRVNQRPLLYAYALFLIGAISVISYQYRVQLNFLLRKYIYSISLGESKRGLYVILAAAFSILIFQAIELFNRYRKKVDDLNFY